KVVDEQSPHEGLNRVIHLGQSHTLLQHFIPVDIHELLRHARQKRCTERADFRALPDGRHEFVQVVCQERDVLAAAILQDKREAAGSADTRYRRRRETEDSSHRKLSQFLVQTRFEGLKLFGLLFTLTPRLQSNEEESAITGPDVAEQTETN